LGSRYRIDGPLGSGGMASVYRATDLRLERPVAVKVLLANHAQDARLVERFEREARTLAAVDHPAIVSIFDVDAGDPASGREPFFVMELCPDGSLADRLATGGPLAPAEVVPLAARIAQGLAALHAQGIVHRDIKPHNILLAPSGPKLADFGIAKLSSAAAGDSLTMAGTALGTLAYAPPETLAGEEPTAASDTYGLAAVVYQALTGQPPRRADNLAQAAETLWARPAPPSAVLPSLGSAFDPVLGAALSPESGQRPDVLTFAAQLEEALGRWQAGATAAPAWADAPTLHDEQPLVPVAAPTHRGGSSPGVGIGIGVATVLLAAALVAAILFLGGQQAADPNDAALPSAPAQTPVAAPPTPAPPTPAPPTPAPPTPEPPTPEPPTPEPPTPEPAPPADDAVASALEELRLAAATLERRVARDILRRVDQVERALDRDDLERAVDEARDLDDLIQESVQEGTVTGDDAQRLQDASRALLDALGAARR
jgi:eukaryotic-like serine/threonine-protein kinase